MPVWFKPWTSSPRDVSSDFMSGLSRLLSFGYTKGSLPYSIIRINENLHD